MASELSLPSFFNPSKMDSVWKVPYQIRANEAEEWAKKNGIKPAVGDKVKICLLPIDCQNTFCLPDFELFVGGRSGMGAIDDNVRLAEFIYRNMNNISNICPTLDTHTAMQIFHCIFWVDENGNHPIPNETMLSYDDVRGGKWKVNPAVAYSVANGNYVALQTYAEHYVKTVTDSGKYALITWGYHAMLGGIGHALASGLEEAVFFHNIARKSQTGFEVKGGNPLTENYSILSPEVLVDKAGNPIAQKNVKFIEKLLKFDFVIIAGQAKSHCVAWSINDLLKEIQSVDPNLAKKVYLLEDCTSPVVIPNVIDFTDQADEAFEKFADAGMHIVKSTTPMSDWDSIRLAA